MQAHKEGWNILLAFNEDIGIALKKAYDYDFDNEAMVLKQAANIVRRDMFSRKSSFSGKFGQTCQQKSVAPSLMTLVGWCLVARVSRLAPRTLMKTKPHLAHQS